MELTLDKTRTPGAVAEVFWLALNALSEPERQAVLKRLQDVPVTQSTIVVRPVHILESLRGLVAWGGDALEDSERLYDNL
jgi:hypothetical protein